MTRNVECLGKAKKMPVNRCAVWLVCPRSKWKKHGSSNSMSGGLNPPEGTINGDAELVG